jgi:prepilin-type N-terminal cleavage/methylation domain-containing protein/prepilin-type processing-associated H-X9-DG protein
MSRASRRGFTLIELLVVVLIIAIIGALLLPATRRVREPAIRMQCANNLKQHLIAMHGYADVNGTFPPGCVGPDAAPETRLSWMVALLPYLEQDALYAKFDLTKGYAENGDAAGTLVKVFVCAANDFVPNTAPAHYVALAGIGHDAATRPLDAPGIGFMGFTRATKPDAIKDGTSNTLALIETRAGVGPWAASGAINVRGFDVEAAPHIGEGRAFGWHTNGANAALVDGSVRFLSAKTDAAKLSAAITIAGNDVVTLD